MDEFCLPTQGHALTFDYFLARLASLQEGVRHVSNPNIRIRWIRIHSDPDSFRFGFGFVRIRTSISWDVWGICVIRAFCLYV